MDVLKRPKGLPCLHTFCLKCLVQFEQKNDVVDDKLPCPLCRQLFVVPDHGLDKLPTNFLIEELIAILAGEQNAGQGKTSNCAICEESFAEKYCIECSDDMCNKCAQGHVRTKLCVNHRIVTQEEKLSSAFVLQTRAGYCGIHKSEALKLYCYDCQQVICVTCHEHIHGKHKCSYFEESSEKFKDQLKVRSVKIVECLKAFNSDEKHLQTVKKHLLDQLSVAEKLVKEASAELKAIIDKQCGELLTTLDTIKAERLKMLQTRLDELEVQRLMVDTYKLYSEELI